MTQRPILLALAFVLLGTVSFSACGQEDAHQNDYVFITNNATDFWNIAEAGVRKAEKELGIRCVMERPTTGTAHEQQRILENVLVRGCAGIAISPKDPPNMVDLLNNACKQTIVICQDSDAPESKRRVYVGTDNFTAGKALGTLMKEAMPEGGKAILFVGTLDAQNAIDREAGIREELKGSNIKVLETRLDHSDESRAKSNAEAIITGQPDVKLLVGLWAYNGPAIAEAVEEANKVGQIKIACFDNLDGTLSAIQKGIIYGTVAQRPYEFGYQSIKILHALNNGDESVIPAGGVVDTGVDLVREDNVDTYWNDLKKKKAPSE